jgi:ADYC domain
MHIGRLIRLLRLVLSLAVLLVATRSDAYQSGQGISLHGEARHVVWFPKQGWVDKNGRPFEEVTVQKGTLIAYREGKPLPVGALDGASVKVEVKGRGVVAYQVVRIDSPPKIPGQPIVDPAGSTRYYTLVEKGTPRPYCRRAPRVWFGNQSYPVDAYRGRQAVPVAEVWNKFGLEGTNDEFFTMACTAGAIGKCYRWGYQGWKPFDEAKSYVQACTRMAMADYCGDGRSHTTEGTPIDLFDFAAPAAINPPPDPGSPIPIPSSYDSGGRQVSFETAWLGGNLRLVHLDAWDSENPEKVSLGGALCLSKKRWDAIPIGKDPLAAGQASLGKCPNLRDPRARAEDNAWRNRTCPRTRQGKRYCKPECREPASYKPGEFCDYFADGQVHADRLKAAGALLFNASPYLDSLLSVWTSVGGTAENRMTATEVDHGPQALAPAPPAGFSRPAVPLGWVLREDLPPSLDAELPRLVTLYSYFNSQNKDHLTTTMRKPLPWPGYDAGKVQGQIHPCGPNTPQPVPSIPLYRYDQGGRHRTTTESLPAGARWESSGNCKESMVGNPAIVRVIEGYLPNPAGP